MQAGHAAAAANDLNAAAYWFELVHTWAPSSMQDWVDLCNAAGAVPMLPVRHMPAVLPLLDTRALKEDPMVLPSCRLLHVLRQVQHL